MKHQLARIFASRRIGQGLATDEFKDQLRKLDGSLSYNDIEFMANHYKDPNHRNTVDINRFLEDVKRE